MRNNRATRAQMEEVVIGMRKLIESTFVSLDGVVGSGEERERRSTAQKRTGNWPIPDSDKTDWFSARSSICTFSRYRAGTAPFGSVFRTSVPRTPGFGLSLTSSLGNATIRGPGSRAPGACCIGRVEQGTKLLLCERGSGHQFSPSSDRLYLVVAVMVLVSTLVSTWCPPSPKIESTAAKW